MITQIHIQNFKSLVNFDLELSRFNCLIGLNGAGKSTVLQALDFISAIMRGEVEAWLEQRGWTARDLKSHQRSESNIIFSVTMERGWNAYEWYAHFNPSKLHCTHEVIMRCNNSAGDLLVVHQGKYAVEYDHSRPPPKPNIPIAFQYQGSLLSQLKPEILSEELQWVKNTLCGLRSFDLLSPPLLHQKSRKGNKSDIGLGGERLSAFIHQLTPEHRASLLEQMKAYYPQLRDIRTKALRSGWIQLELVEEYLNDEDQTVTMTTEAKHINDGLLRLLAILALQFSPLQTLLFDEIENGINSEIIEKIADALVKSPKQIIVTTHSLMLLNYLEDAVAVGSVMLIVKGARGMTWATRFFEIPTVAAKLRGLAPGDAMLDVYLQQVADEAQEVERQRIKDEASKLDQAMSDDK